MILSYEVDIYQPESPEVIILEYYESGFWTGIFLTILEFIISIGMMILIGKFLNIFCGRFLITYNNDTSDQKRTILFMLFPHICFYLFSLILDIFFDYSVRIRYQSSIYYHKSNSILRSCQFVFAV